MNHKRHRPKHQRAGCLLCKPHKDERTRQRERLDIEATALDEYGLDTFAYWSAEDWDP